MESSTLAPEPRWPVLIAILAVGGLYLALPEHLTMGPNWALLGILTLLLVPTVASHYAGKAEMNRRLGFVVGGVLTIALVWSVGALILSLPERKQDAAGLLRSAVCLWFCNILVFATWYWRLDAGGPHARDSRGDHSSGAFLFPQMSMKKEKGWRPGFVDYLFLAFNTSTAFSPTDVPPLTPWAKLLMIAQSCVSLGTIVILAGRAVNMF